MRRFVKALVFKRDKSDSQTPASDLPSSASDDGHITFKKSRKTPHSLRIKSFISNSSSRAPGASSLASSPSTPQLSVNGDHVHSSSASSSGSVDISLQTPDDDRASLVPPPARDKSWNMWVVNKKTTSATAKENLLKELPKEWLDPPQIPHVTDSSKFFRRESKASVYDTADEISTGSDEAFGVAAIPLPTAVAREKVRLLIESKLVPEPVSFPLASSGHLYPRSCNRSADLPRKRSMTYTLFQKRLLSSVYVDRTSFDVVSLPPTVTTRRFVPPDPLASSPHDISWPSKKHQVTSYSIGIRRWIARPCFEETHNVYLPSDEGIVVRQVSGTSMGVPALDYSEALDVLADPTYYTFEGTAPRSEIPVLAVVPPSTPEPTLPPQSSSSSNLMSSSILVRNHVSAVPSPLRNGVLSSTSGEREESRSSSFESTPPSNPVRRGVHFADDEDDALPLHIIRMKRKREEKAKFLRSEQRRREVEARQLIRQEEAERQRRELERIERERELQERRVREEAKKQQLYVEEVNAARLRRELNRAGASSGSIGPLPSSLSSTRLRDTEQAPQARYNRSSSWHDVPPVSRRGSSSPGTPPQSSSGSSRAPSINGQAVATFGDRDAAMNSVYSPEDFRRNSAIAKGGLRPSASRTTTYPMLANTLFMQPVPAVQTVSPVPVMAPYMMPVDPSFTMDMPLLPPVPPFMMHQYPRRPSRNSSNSSSSRVPTSANSSSERVDQSRSLHSLSPSASSSRSSGFTSPPSTRRSSAAQSESRRASMPPTAGQSDRPTKVLSSSQSQPPSASLGNRRGRSHVAPHQQSQVLSPWTALPTKTGALPVAMPRAR